MPNHIARFFVFLCVIGICITPVANGQSLLVSERLEIYESWVELLMRKRNYPAISVGLVHQGELIYAKETQNYMPKNHFTQMAWNCEFYAKNGKLIAIMSLGHGKTEDEEWNPDVIFDMYKNRLTELKRIKK